MIKFKMVESDGVELVGLGLSHSNIARLLNGKPIIVELKEMGMSGRVFIFAGKTEQSMAKDLEEFVGPSTVVRGRAPG